MTFKFPEPEVNATKRDWVASFIKNAYNYTKDDQKINHLNNLLEKYESPVVAISTQELRDDMLFLNEIFE